MACLVGGAEVHDDRAGCGAGDEEAGEVVPAPPVKGGEFDVVHDDEAVEEGGEGAGGCGLEEDGIIEQEGGEVCLDAALGVEDEAVVALAGFEGGDVVGDHAVEPADAVGAGDAEPAEVRQRGEGGRGEEGGEGRRFGLRRGLWSCAWGISAYT